MSTAAAAADTSASSVPLPPSTADTAASAAAAAATASRPGTVDAPMPTNTGGLTQGTSLSVLVTGATGTTGREVLRLMARDAAYRAKFKIVAGIHRDHGGADDAVLRAADVVRAIDADSLSSLDFRGVDALFIIPSNAENRVEQVANYVQAAKRDGVKFVLLLSVVQSASAVTGDAPSTLFGRQFAAMEAHVSDSGIPCAFLRCTFHMQNLLGVARCIDKRGELPLPIAQDDKCAPVHVIDVARASCAILADPTVHQFRAYDLVGPEFLTGAAMAAAASRVLGFRIAFRPCSTAEFADMYAAQGVPHWLAAGFAEILALEQAPLGGASDKPATQAAAEAGAVPSKGFYETLTGHAPITLMDFFAQYADVFGAPEVIEGVLARGKPRYRARASSSSSSYSTSSMSSSDYDDRRAYRPGVEYSPTADRDAEYAAYLQRYHTSATTGPGYSGYGGAPPAYRRRAPPAAGTLDELAHVRAVLRELVLERQEQVRAKAAWVAREEDQVARLVSAIEGYGAGGWGDTYAGSSGRRVWGGGDKYAYGGGGARGYDDAGYGRGTYGGAGQQRYYYH